MPVSNLTTVRLAEKLDVSHQAVNELLLKRPAVLSNMALPLSRLFGNTPEFWLEAQNANDQWKGEKKHGCDIAGIKPLKAALMQTKTKFLSAL
jgi:addiction module HigA family antidote